MSPLLLRAALLCFAAALSAPCSAAPALIETMPTDGAAYPWPLPGVAGAPTRPNLGGRPPPPPPPPTLAFAASFGDHMVLQQSPAQAAVFGTLPANTSVGPVTVKVTGTADDASAAAVYTVTASVDAGGNWKALLKPTAAGGSYTVAASTGSFEASINDVTFGDVWYCSGQSNMALPVLHTMSRNISMAAIVAGKYNKIRLHGLQGNMNPFMNWTTAMDAATKFAPGQHGTLSTSKVLETFSSTCWYYGESLVDELGDDAPPIGLIHTAWGGSMIEQWLDNATVAECANVSVGSSNAEFHATRVLPYVNMTLKGWVWYQGENDMHGYFGNSLRKAGYACLMPKLVSTWRALWSTTPGTTDESAPFGVVTLAASGAEGGADISAMRVAQAGSHASLPNPDMPNTFLAHAYDLSDPYGNISCYKGGCCDFTNPNNTHAKCHGCSSKYGDSGDGPELYPMFCDVQTSFYMGPIHPRVKKPVGVRLAKAAASIAYSKGGVSTGPTLSGCTKDGGRLTLSFNKTLLGVGGGVSVKPRATWGYGSMVDVLVNKTAWCVQIKSLGKKAPTECWDDGFGHLLAPGPPYDVEYKPMPPCTKSHGCGARHNASFAWMPVDIMAGPTPNTVAVDLTLAGGVAHAVRYAFVGGGDCCSGRPPTSAPCDPGSCPLQGSGDAAAFPATPFVAQITDAGKCACIPPIVCDE